MADENQLGAIEHVVLLMLENRSFDHLFGYLYADAANRSAAGQDFEGLTGAESNLDATGASVPVAPLAADSPHPYFSPGPTPVRASRPRTSSSTGPRALRRRRAPPTAAS